MGDPFRDWTNAIVSVDGFLFSNVVEADTDEGWVDVVACDDAGNVICEGDAIKIERLYGAVTVAFRQTASP